MCDISISDDEFGFALFASLVNGPILKVGAAKITIYFTCMIFDYVMQVVCPYCSSSNRSIDLVCVPVQIRCIRCVHHAE